MALPRSTFSLTKKITEMVNKFENVKTILTMLEARFESSEFNEQKRLVDMCSQLCKLKGSSTFDQFVYRMRNANKAFGTENRLNSIGVVNDFINIFNKFGLTDQDSVVNVPVAVAVNVPVAVVVNVRARAPSAPPRPPPPPLGPLGQSARDRPGE